MVIQQQKKMFITNTLRFKVINNFEDSEGTAEEGFFFSKNKILERIFLLEE